MTPSDSTVPLESFQTFGDLLKYLRRRARLTQREVAIAVGYSEAQISRLEQNQRLPDVAALTALFIPALYLEDEPLTVDRLMELAARARGENPSPRGTVTFSHSAQRQMKESLRIVEENVQDNLPLQLTSFVGREREIAEIKSLLGSNSGKTRLITLTGSGGCGKTRLALETARQLVDSYPDGIWWIELASLSDPVHVPYAFFTSLGLPEPCKDKPAAALTKALRELHTLLIVDNCEHLLLQTAKLIHEILVSSPHVQVMATSREILNIPGEVRFRVPSLTVSADLDSESVRLFIERAKASFPAFAFTKEHTQPIAQICSRLDGIPLAIELAAARMTALSVQQIATRLENSFRLLSGGSETLARHQTLRAAIAWSYNLLAENECRLLQRLSIFSGGWTLEAAESVASDSSSIPVESVPDLLSQLVNKSLVIVKWESKTEPRFSLLQTIHEFAREKLYTAGEVERLRSRHFEYFHTLAQQGEQTLFAEQSSMDRMEAEIDNLRAALTWALETKTDGSYSGERTGQALEIMTYVWPLWLFRGYLSEGREWMKQLLAAHPAGTPARARALTLAADFARYHGDYMGQVALIQEALALSRKLGDKKRIAWSLMEMGLVERDLHQYSNAISLLSESVERFQALHETLWIYRSSFLLAETYMSDENLEAARPLWEKGLELCSKENDRLHIAWGLEGLGHLERLEEHFERARQLYRESLHLKIIVMDKAGITHGIEAFAQLAASQNQFQRASVLWSAGEKLHQTLNLLLPPSREKIYTSLLLDARNQLSEAEFQAAWAEGQAMNMQMAIDYALDLPDDGLSAIP
jgi:predicted ATPase/transcriptional regulator with XRE-family HTH domain